MKESLCAHFPKCEENKCHSRTISKEFFIVDNTDGRSEIYKGDNLEYPYCTVKNHLGKVVGFVAIDSCIFLPGDSERCDCAVYDDNTFCFIELKRSLDPKFLTEKTEKAANQLRETISQFKSVLDFEDRKLEALLCVGFNAPSPKANASNQSLTKEFMDSFDVELFTGNVFEFS